MASSTPIAALHANQPPAGAGPPPPLKVSDDKPKLDSLSYAEILQNMTPPKPPFVGGGGGVVPQTPSPPTPSPPPPAAPPPDPMQHQWMRQQRQQMQQLQQMQYNMQTQLQRLYMTQATPNTAAETESPTAAVARDDTWAKDALYVCAAALLVGFGTSVALRRMPASLTSRWGLDSLSPTTNLPPGGKWVLGQAVLVAAVYYAIQRVMSTRTAA